jgi:phosphoribosylamine---glycine ligase
LSKLNVLVLGSGGREHALCWKIAQSPILNRLYCLPGNAGTNTIATNIIHINTNDFQLIKDFCFTNDINLFIVGPEDPLINGIVDYLDEANIPVFGPNHKAAQLEGSKSFCKDVLLSAGIPTAKYQIFDNPKIALDFINLKSSSCVIKADGLAAGKGVYICHTKDEAIQAITNIMIHKIFGNAGDRIVIEDMLEGEEASITALIDGENIILLPTAQDHKRIFDGDQGPNTGGMGAYSPAPIITEQLKNEIVQQTLQPTLNELRKRNIIYRGVLYAGLMITKTGPKVLEYNCRFGDPETQVILPLIESDLLPIFYDIACKKTIKFKPKTSTQSAVCVVMASGGYPDKYQKGLPIKGLEIFNNLNDTIIFHAGTKASSHEILTNGGRVLGVTGIGNSIKEAADKAYYAIKFINFDNCYFRKDIAWRALK